MVGEANGPHKQFHTGDHLKLLMGTRMARAVSKEATCNRLKVGAILMSGDHIVSTGYNGRPKGEEACKCQVAGTVNLRCSDSVHAELNALLFCEGPTAGTRMVVTHAPCYECAAAIINAEVVEVYYLEAYGNWEGIARLQKQGIQCVHVTPAVLGAVA